MDFAVILNGKIEYCSNENNYSKFEIALFADMLIREVGDAKTWRLHKIVFREIPTDKQLKLLTYTTQSMIICVLGEFSMGSTYGYYLLEKIHRQLEENFDISSFQNLPEKDKEKFLALCNLIKLTLFGNLHKKVFDESSSHEIFDPKVELVYAGISSAGAPIISHIYDNQDLLVISDQARKNILITVLSGQLATISINSFIRAQSFMDSIQIKIISEDGRSRYLFFNFKEFGKNKNFVLEILCTGAPDRIEALVEDVTRDLNEMGLFNEEFSGNLRKYAPVKEYFLDLVNKFNIE